MRGHRAYIRSYFFILSLFIFAPFDCEAAQVSRVANSSIRMPSRLAPPTYTTETAFPEVYTSGVVAITSPPGETNRLFLVEKGGLIVVISDLRNPTRNVLLDLTDRVYPDGEAGLLGLAFHPNFRQNGRFFVFYTLNTVSMGPHGEFQEGLHDRLSRFQVSGNYPDSADRSSEQVLISQFDRADNHNGGDVHFGPDGYLYVSLGDEGGGGDDFGNSQRIDRNFFSGMLRLDVDESLSSLEPNSHPAVVGGYKVPSDNPFVGATSFNGWPVDPASVRTEFWAVGLRNPWRFSFDSETGDLLCGDVGQNAREEVDLIRRGGNYGWNYVEGMIPYVQTAPAAFVPTPPLLDYLRPGEATDLERQGYCVIGGVVYHGTQLPELSNKYLFGDYGSGYIWAMRHDGVNATEFYRLLSGFSMTCFGTDPRNGDLLIGGNFLLRLVRSEASEDLPASLAETGAFSDVESLVPSEGVVPYEINVPFWSDHAKKARWFSVPNLQDTIQFKSEGAWSFPSGTVWIKHFDLEMTEGDPTSSRRIETRLLVKTDDGVYGATYRWGGSTENATLVPADGQSEEFTIVGPSGPRQQVWHYPSRSECLSCHTGVAGYALGFNTPQLNRTITNVYDGSAQDQLKSLADAGYFSHPLPAPGSLSRLAAADDETATTEFRVRSYLAANCVQCHQPGGTGLGKWDARLETPTTHAGLINGLLNDNGGNPEARVIRPGSLENSMLLSRINHRGPGQMPPLASSVVDDANVALISNWITNGLVQPTGDTLTLLISGLGTPRGATNGQRLTSGKSYSVTALPAAGYLFSHWSGSINSTANPLKFQMRPGLVLQANFVVNRFQSLQGTYGGLFGDPSGFNPNQAGTVNGVVQNNGKFTAVFQLAQARVPVAGRFNVNGTWTNTVRLNQGRGDPVTVECLLDSTLASPWTGRVVGPGWSVPITAVKAAPQLSRRYSWATSLHASTALATGGESFGSLRIGSSGLATWTGLLANGSPISAATVISADGRFPIAVVRTGKSGSIFGWGQIVPEQTLSGSFSWFTNASPQPYWPAVPLNGSVSSATTPAAGSSVALNFSGGGLSSPLDATVTLQGSSTVAVRADNSFIRLKLDAGTGQFSGSIRPPGQTATRSFKGAWSRQPGTGAGILLTPGNPGLVELKLMD